jgi:hypothetical protein
LRAEAKTVAEKATVQRFFLARVLSKSLIGSSNAATCHSGIIEPCPMPCRDGYVSLVV